LPAVYWVRSWSHFDVERIGIDQDAAFAAVGNREWHTYAYTKMTFDWFDFVSSTCRNGGVSCKYYYHGVAILFMF